MNHEPHTNEHPMQFATIGEYLRSIGRSRGTLSLWLRGLQLDPWGDVVVTNRTILGGRRKNIEEDLDRFGDFKDFLSDWAEASRRKWPIPAYVKNAVGKGRGAEGFTAEDLVTTEIRDLCGSRYWLWFKNREWLHVFAEDGSESRLHIDVVHETGVPKERFWPFADALKIWVG